MGRTYEMCARNEKCVKNFLWEKRRFTCRCEGNTVEDRNVLKWGVGVETGFIRLRVRIMRLRGIS
jgi:hypothetical protein